MTPVAVAVMVSLAVGCLGGCTIVEMRADNERGQARVDDKAADLEQARLAQARMQAERARLVSDLRTRELGVSELKARLQELQRINERSGAATQEQARQKAARGRQLGEAAERVQRLEEAPATPDKARRLEEVRRQLRSTLEQLTIT